MDNTEQKVVQMGEVVDRAKAFILFLFKNWKLFFVCVIITVALALAYFYSQKPNYLAVTTFILEEKSNSSGGLAGLASQIGIDITSVGSGSGLFAGDNILDILKSRMIVEKVLLSKVDTANKTDGNTLADRYLVVSKIDRKLKQPVTFTTCIPDKPNTRLQDSVLFLMYKNLIKKNFGTERLNKKGTIIRVSTESGDEVFSKFFTERVLAAAKNLYIDIKTNNAQEVVSRLQRRSDSLLSIMNYKSYQTASLQVVDANPVFKNSIVPLELSMRDKSVVATVYSEVVKNLEASRMALAQQTPVIQLLDTPKYPLDDQEKPLKILLAIAIGLSFLIFLVVSFYQYK